jgi:hypothetical protein
MVGEFRVAIGVAKRKVCVETSSKTCAIQSRVFVCPLFYGDPVQKLHGSVGNKVCVETSSKPCAIQSRVFVCPLFYGDPVQKLHGFPFFPYSRSETRPKMMCGYVFQARLMAMPWSFLITIIKAGMLFALKFRLFRWGIQVSTMCHCTLQPFQD